jgi:hypothetical protein
MPQVDIDGANSKVSADTIRGQSGTTVTIQSGHNLVGSGSGLTALPAANLTGTLPAISGASLTGVGGAWTLIGTQVASSDATLTQTGLSSTYDVYKIFLSAIVPTTDGTGCFFLVGDSGGIDVGGSDYNYHFANINTDSGSYGAGYDTSSDYLKIAGNVGSSTGEGIGSEITIFCPSDGGLYANVFWNTSYLNATGTAQGGAGWGARVAIITLDRIQIKFAAGSIESGRLSVFGLSHS